MPKVTNRNYYSVNNRALTNSKIGDWLKDKNYFFRKHILGEVEQKVTDALIMGSAVDTWITEGEKKFREKYYVVTRRIKTADDYEFQLNNTMMTNVENICRKVELQDAYKELKGYKAQKIIQAEMDLGEHFDKIMGKPDWYKIDEKNKTCTILDLKTAKTADEKKYFFHCLDYGYFRQQAFYQLILEQLHPEIEKFFSFHLVVEKDPDEIFKCMTFELAQDRIELEKKLIQKYIEDIKEEKKFQPTNVSFSRAITIGRMEDEF